MIMYPYEVDAIFLIFMLRGLGQSIHTTGKIIAVICHALLHGKEPFAVKKGRRVHGKEDKHGKKKKRHTTKKHHTVKAQKQRTAKKDGTTKTRNNTRQRKPHGKARKRPTVKKIHGTPLGGPHPYGIVDGAMVTAGLCRVTYCQAH
jgi:hypothetical protein